MGADRSALTALGVLGALVVVLAATTVGGLRPVSLGTTTSQHAGRTGDPATHGHASEPGHAVGGPGRVAPLRPPLGPDWLPTWGRLTGIVVLACVVLALLASVRIRVLRRRRLPPPRTVRASPAVEEPGGAEPAALRSLLDHQLSTLDGGTPRNAIVEAWVQLEDFAADHGIPRRPADTPAEFVVRALAAYRLDPGSLQLLAELYREARFSTHAMAEADREEARRCLLSLTEAGAPS